MYKFLKHFLSLFWILMVFTSFGQDSLSVTDADMRYREDQFYIGLTYNLLNKVPSNINLNGVSGGIQFGYLRDMPINEQRNISIAIGAGMAFDQYGQNLFIGERPVEETIFRPLLDDVDYDTNRFSTSSLEIPLEFRWRTSTATEYKFWRIYTGVRMSYTYWYSSLFKQTDNKVTQTKISEFQPLNFALTFAFGYATFNFYANYSLTPFFKDAYTEDTREEIGFSPLKLGLIFYIL
jgi:hypothetical protein